MSAAKHGDTVKVHYKGTLEDGSIFDTSENMDPLEFTLGEGFVIPGFENAVLGMNLGDSKTVKIEPLEAYGEKDEDLIIAVDRNELPPEIQPEVGMILKATNKEDGETMPLTIVEVNDDTVTLDGNHPLAGLVLQFDIQLVEIL